MASNSASSRREPIAAGAARAAILAGKYRLDKRLAAGGGGEIWAGRNESTRARVALKFLRGGPHATEELRTRFHQEARIGGLLSHRNIVRVMDLIETEEHGPVLVLELLHGETLADYIARRAPLHVREALAIALPVLSALAHAHDLGVVHRDITPRNVFLVRDPDGHILPKLLDFGLSKVRVWESCTQDGSMLGTPSYMSPEQMRSDPTVDGRADLYSLGTVIYEMVTGSPPYRRATPQATLVAALEAVAPPRLDGVEPAVADAVAQAMQKDREARFDSARGMADALRRAIDATDEALAVELQETSSIELRVPSERTSIDPSAAMVRSASAKHSGRLAVVQGSGASWPAEDAPPRRGSARPWLLAGAFAAGGALVVGVVAARMLGDASIRQASADSRVTASPPPAVPVPVASSLAGQSPGGRSASVAGEGMAAAGNDDVGTPQPMGSVRTADPHRPSSIAPEQAAGTSSRPSRPTPPPRRGPRVTDPGF